MANPTEAEGANRQDPTEAGGRPFGVGGFGRRGFGVAPPPTQTLEVTPSPDSPVAEVKTDTAECER